MASAASTGWRSCYCQPLCAQYSAATSCTLHIRESWYVTTAAAWCHPAWILGPCQAARGHSGPHSLSGTGRHASRPPVTNNFCCWYGRRSSFLWEPDLLLCTTWEGQSVCPGLCYTNHNNITSSEFQKIQWPWKQNLSPLNIIKSGITHHMDNKKLSRGWEARATRLCLASSEYYFRFFGVPEVEIWPSEGIWNPPLLLRSRLQYQTMGGRQLYCRKKTLPLSTWTGNSSMATNWMSPSTLHTSYWDKIRGWPWKRPKNGIPTPVAPKPEVEIWRKPQQSIKRMRLRIHVL